MKKLAFILLFISILFSQELRVTAMNGASVEPPKMDIANGYVHLTYATNYRYYRFPVAGPQTPISNPTNVYPTQWGPNSVSIAASGNYVQTSCIDWVFTGYNYYLFSSLDGGSNWPGFFFVDTVEKGNSITLRGDVPKISDDNEGSFYHLWFVYQNKDGIARLMFSNENGISKKEIGDTNYESAVNISARKISDKNIVVITYAVSPLAKTYCVVSTNGGQSFSAPKAIISLNNTMGFTDFNKSWSKILPNGNIYVGFSYNQMSFGQPGMHEWSGGTFLYKSTDYGQNWSYFTQVDTVYEFYSSRYDMTDNGTIVKLFTDAQNFKIGTSLNGISWNITNKQISVDTLNPYGFNLQIVDNSKAAVAWIDKRTGDYEIFYKLIDLPTPPVKIEDNLITEKDFNLYQNYPNPFNPTTIIKFTLNKNSSNVKLKIFDITGKTISVILDKALNAGTYEIPFNAENLTTGVYLVTLENNNIQKTIKILYLK